METTNITVSAESTDQDLLSAVRLGDSTAFEYLYKRYRPMAQALAYTHTSDACSVDDIVSESFARILQALKNGNGPKEYMGGYISTTVAHLAAEYGLISTREVPRENEHLESMGALDETVLQLHEADEVVSAFTNLPERWQTVLWLTEVEERRPRDVATALNMSPNAVSALAVRARESLREGFLRAHQQAPMTNECNRYTYHISAYVRGSLSQKRSDALLVHMQSCTFCTSEYLSLASINKSMRTWIFPVLAGLGVLVTDSSKVLAAVGFGELGVAGTAGAASLDSAIQLPASGGSGFSGLSSSSAGAAFNINSGGFPAASSVGASAVASAPTGLTRLSPRSWSKSGQITVAVAVATVVASAAGVAIYSAAVNRGTEHGIHDTSSTDVLADPNANPLDSGARTAESSTQAGEKGTDSSQSAGDNSSAAGGNSADAGGNPSDSQGNSSGSGSLQAGSDSQSLGDRGVITAEPPTAGGAVSGSGSTQGSSNGREAGSGANNAGDTGSQTSPSGTATPAPGATGGSRDGQASAPSEEPTPEATDRAAPIDSGVTPVPDPGESTKPIDPVDPVDPEPEPTPEIPGDPEAMLVPVYKDQPPTWVDSAEYQAWRAQVPLDKREWPYEGYLVCRVVFEFDGGVEEALHWLPPEILGSIYTNYEIMRYFGYDAVLQTNPCY